MQEDGVISAEQKEHALAAAPKVIAFARPRRDSGFQFVDFLAREARLDGIESLTAQSYTVHSTINAQLQRDTEAALQEGLAQYELSPGRSYGGGLRRALQMPCKSLRETTARARRPGSKR
jgi:membrane peptidoglycan carboxypeptidase